MILQITNGSLSADYTIVVLVGCVGALIISFGMMVSWAAIRALKQIEIELKEISNRVDTVVENHLELEREVIIMRERIPDPDILASQIVMKIRALSEMRNI